MEVQNPTSSESNESIRGEDVVVRVWTESDVDPFIPMIVQLVLTIRLVVPSPIGTLPSLHHKHLPFNIIDTITTSVATKIGRAHV